VYGCILLLFHKYYLQQTVMSEQPGDAILTSGEGDQVAMAASKATLDGSFAQVPNGGGLYTTQLYDPTKPASAMGAAGPNIPLAPPAPYKTNPQAPYQLQYGSPIMAMTTPATTAAASPSSNTNTTATAASSTNSNPKKRTASERRMSEQQKSERRERNREHAKRSRIRKKFLLESLQQSVSLLKEENDKLRGSIRSHLGNETAETLMTSMASPANNSDGLLADGHKGANKILDDPDFSFIKALQTAQQNFVVTDPSLPDNPIVYASQGFLNLTGYTLDQILGRNCRFLQGPETDPKSVERIRKAIESGNDMSVCLLNYRVDGTTFWNQFFIAALRDAAGEVTNYVGVQCKVSDLYAATVTKQQDQENDDDDDE
jgi:PAS domain S-box-containing protein